MTSTSTAGAAAPAVGARRGDGLRTDIQGLRAIAVAIVVAYHLAPRGLTGGFVGVDVFFVISGFLITSHLLAGPPASGRDLAGFWSRRIRRLLPASLLVLTATLVASRLVAPQTQWSNTASQVRAAAVYVVNWVLARDAVDYLAAENAPSPVQHFWSLSVEEQFYFVWPVLILVLVLLARRTRSRPSVTVAAGLTAVVVASLAWSVHETATNPPAAYFVTPTRMWELGIGGLLAVATAPRALGRDDSPRVPPAGAALVLSWGGLAAIAWTTWRYSGATPFPGYTALLPVLGAACVIAGHPRRGDRFSPGRVLALRPVQWLGDVSYSVYLWHWPLIVLVPAVSGGHLGNLDRLVIVLATLVLAGLTKPLVEDRFRKPRWGRPLRKPYLLGAIGMAVVVGLASLQIAEVNHNDAVALAQVRRAVARDNPCFGAASLDPGKHCGAVPYDKIVPAPAEAALDKSDAYSAVSGGKDCWSYLPRFPTVTCTFGRRTSAMDIALVGNSHAGEWLPALQVLAKQHGWRITTYLASRCAMAATTQRLDTGAESAACRRWATRTAERVARARPDLVVLANRVSAPAGHQSLAASRPAYRAGYARVLRTWRSAGLRALVLHDSPYPGGSSVPDCIASHEADYRVCGGPRSTWVRPDPAAAAVSALDDPRIRFLDLTDHICGPRTCRAVTGGVVTYFDGSHLTATYVRTLAPYLDEPLRKLLRG